MCPEPTSSDPPTSLSVSKWTMDGTFSTPPKKPSIPAHPQTRGQEGRGLDYISSQAREGGQVRERISPHAPLLQTAASQGGSEKSVGPLPLLCPCRGTWPGPLLLWAWDPTAPSLLNRTCYPGSWLSELHLEVLASPSSSPPFLPTPPHPPTPRLF